MKNKKTFFKTEIVKNYLKRFANTPSLTLAKKIYSENNEHFKNVEDARDVVRYCRGVKGKQNRKDAKTNFGKFYVKPNSLNPYGLPVSYAQKSLTFTLPKEHNNILFISDLHIPFHDIKAINAMIKYGLEHNINAIFINGDLLDFYQISRFVNIERKRSVKDELRSAKLFLQRLNELFPNVPIYFLKGNHDIRLELYLATKAPELLDMEEFHLEELLECKKHNVKILEDTTLVKIGGLNVTHGHLLIKGVFAPVSPARGAFLKAKASVIIGHTHKYSNHQETTIAGKTISCYSTGCLCELNPTYNPFANNFTHGFAHIKVENGYYKVRNIQILNGEILN